MGIMLNMWIQGAIGDSQVIFNHVSKNCGRLYFRGIPLTQCGTYELGGMRRTFHDRVPILANAVPVANRNIISEERKYAMMHCCEKRREK